MALKRSGRDEAAAGLVEERGKRMCGVRDARSCETSLVSSLPLRNELGHCIARDARRSTPVVVRACTARLETPVTETQTCLETRSAQC